MFGAAHFGISLLRRATRTAVVENSQTAPLQTRNSFQGKGKSFEQSLSAVLLALPSLRTPKLRRSKHEIPFREKENLLNNLSSAVLLALPSSRTPKLRRSKREIDKKLSAAKKALSENRGYFANSSKIVGELMDLEIGDTEEVWSFIIELLEEIEIDDYAGSRPPMRSYEPCISNCELFAFSWLSRKLQQEMYLKFALKKGDFYYVSLHKSRKK